MLSTASPCNMPVFPLWSVCIAAGHGRDVRNCAFASRRQTIVQRSYVKHSWTICMPRTVPTCWQIHMAAIVAAAMDQFHIPLSAEYSIFRIVWTNIDVDLVSNPAAVSDVICWFGRTHLLLRRDLPFSHPNTCPQSERNKSQALKSTTSMVPAVSGQTQFQSFCRKCDCCMKAWEIVYFGQGVVADACQCVTLAPSWI